MMSLFSSFLKDHLEVSHGKRIVGVLVAVTDPLKKREPNTGCLGTQLGIRLTWSHRCVGFCTTIRTATWSLDMDRSPRLSEA